MANQLRRGGAPVNPAQRQQRVRSLYQPSCLAPTGRSGHRPLYAQAVEIRRYGLACRLDLHVGQARQTLVRGVVAIVVLSSGAGVRCASPLTFGLK
jgi:hypothetical protein